MADVRIPICVRCGADLVRTAGSEVACRSCDGRAKRTSHGAPSATMVPASSVSRGPSGVRTRPVAIAAALATALWAGSFAHHGDGLNTAFATAERTAVQPVGTSVQRSVQVAVADGLGRTGTASTLASAGAQTSPVDPVTDAAGLGDATAPTPQEGDTGSITDATTAASDTTSTLPELAQAGPVSGSRQGARAPARPDEVVVDDTVEGPDAADPFGPGTDGADSAAPDIAPPWPSPGATAPTTSTATTATTITTVRPPATTAPAPTTTPPPVVTAPPTTAPPTTAPATTTPETTAPAAPAPTTTTPPPDPDPTPAP